MHLQVLDIEGSIEKLGFDPLDDTKVSALVLPTAMFLTMGMDAHAYCGSCLRCTSLVHGCYGGESYKVQDMGRCMLCL